MSEAGNIESVVSDAVGRALSFSSDVSRRDFGLGFPIIYWIGWIFVAYLIFMFLSIYVGPALFGTNPYYGRPYWGRNVPMRPHIHQNPLVRMANGGIVGMDENAATHLTAQVTRAVAGPGRN